MTTHHPLSETAKTSEFQKALETVEALPLDAQEVLIDIIEKRIAQQRRENLIQEVEEAREEFAKGHYRSGSVADLMAELDNCPD